MMMFNPPHPGEILKEIYLTPLSLTITTTAEGLNMSRQTISELVNKKIGVSAETAMKLGKAFDTSAEYWLNLQLQYDLWRVQDIDLSQIKRLVA